MAALSPKNVITILLEMPLTENIRVHEDIVEAASVACDKEPEITSKLVKKEIGWIRFQPYLLLIRPERISYLIKQLCRANIIGIALDLAKALLDILPEPPRDEDAEAKAFRTLSEPRSRFNKWEYEHLLENLQPILVENMRLRALTLFCDLLQDAIRYSKNTEGEGEEKSEDFSYIWRPAIEDYSQNHSNDLKDDLQRQMLR